MLTWDSALITSLPQLWSLCIFTKHVGTVHIAVYQNDHIEWNIPFLPVHLKPKNNPSPILKRRGDQSETHRLFPSVALAWKWSVSTIWEMREEKTPLFACLTEDTQFKTSFNYSVLVRLNGVSLIVRTGHDHNKLEYLRLNLTHSWALFHILLSDDVPECQHWLVPCIMCL